MKDWWENLILMESFLLINGWQEVPVLTVALQCRLQILLMENLCQKSSYTLKVGRWIWIRAGSRSWVDDDFTGSMWVFLLTLESELGEDSWHRQRWKCIKNCLFFFLFYFEIFFGLQTDYPSSINNLFLGYHKVCYCLTLIYHDGSTRFSNPVFLSWDLETFYFLRQCL